MSRSNSRPISSNELARALECRLVQPDDRRWEVVEVSFQQERTWVRARPATPGHEGGDGSGGRPWNGGRLFDIALPTSARLEWMFPGGWIVCARRDESGALQWSVEGPSGRVEVDRAGAFFRDAFLGASPDRGRRDPPSARDAS